MAATADSSRQAVARQSGAAAPELTPVSRVLQFRGRRQILRLEPAFWNMLKDAARRRGVAVGELVHRLLETAGDGNFTAYVRCFCLAEAQGRGLAAGRSGGLGDLRRALAASPAPAVLLSESAVVTWLNAAAGKLLGERAPTMPGNRVDALFRFHPPDLLARARALDPDGAALPGRLIHAAPGRLVTMQAWVTPPLAAGMQLLWLAVNPPARLPSTQPRSAAGAPA